MALDKDDYYMAVAKTVAQRSTCATRQVGAVLVRGDRIIATGYNGTPAGMANCTEWGCSRCTSGKYASGQGYDKCICVHAEANAVLSAARFGAAVEGAVLYSTDQPCFGCSKDLIQAGVARVLWAKPWTTIPPEDQVDYDHLRVRLNSMQLPQDSVTCETVHAPASGNGMVKRSPKKRATRR